MGLGMRGRTGRSVTPRPLFLEFAESSKKKESSTSAKAFAEDFVLEKMSVELGYWKIRGLGAPLRMILTYAEARLCRKYFALEALDAAGILTCYGTRCMGSNPNVLWYAQVDFKDVQYADGESWFKGRKPALL
jgi:hypothetical protein